MYQLIYLKEKPPFSVFDGGQPWFARIGNRSPKVAITLTMLVVLLYGQAIQSGQLDAFTQIGNCAVLVFAVCEWRLWHRVNKLQRK